MTDSATDTETAPEPAPDPNAVAIVVNGTPFTARKGELIIAAAERAGAYIPRFCYHPRMDPVGMCRQCLVEVDSGRGPALMPSCMFPVAPDMKIETESPTAKRAQEGMIELLLANHPLDCPVCDKGGECPLQDQAFSHGPGESRYVEAKRNFEKPIPISDLVLLDRERCILCDRCTRFADEVAGDKLIHFINRGNLTQVNTFPDEPFASYFSGNVVQICPVGALTAKPYRFKARPWDLEQVDSTCTTCSVGCTISVHSSRDQLLRYQGVDTGDDADAPSVNWGWMCDRGRFGFEATESPNRIGTPLVRTDDGFVETTWSAALAIAKQLVDEASTIGLLGGARSTNEGVLAWARLADALGVTYRDAQLGDGLPAELLGLPRATIDEAAGAATVILLGPDLKEELPVLYLRLRDAAVRKRTRIIEFSSHTTGMSRYAWRTVQHLPGAGASEIASALAEPDVAAQLATGKVVVVAGRGNLAESQSSAMTALRAVIDAIPGVGVLPALRRGNVVGALQLGLAPSDHDHDGLATLRAAADGKLDLLVLLGADPINDCPDADLARRALAGVERIVSIDTFMSDSTRQADLVLAAAAFGEQDGTTTNLEGRVLDRQPGGHGPRHVSTRLDDRRRAGLDVRPRSRIRLDRVGSRSRRRRNAGIVRTDRLTGTVRTAAQQLRLPAGREPQALRPRRRHRHVALSGSRSRSAPRRMSTRSISTGWASPTAPRSRSSGRAVRSCCRWSPTKRSSAARSGRRSTRTGPTSPISSTPRRR